MCAFNKRLERRYRRMSSTMSCRRSSSVYIKWSSRSCFDWIHCRGICCIFADRIDTMSADEATPRLATAADVAHSSSACDADVPSSSHHCMLAQRPYTAHVFAARVCRRTSAIYVNTTNELLSQGRLRHSQKHAVGLFPVLIMYGNRHTVKRAVSK